MPRVTNKVASRKRKKRLLKHAKGFRGGKKLFRNAKETIEKGWQYSYRDRKGNKRNFRRLWITRINAAVHEHDLSYSKFIYGLKLLNIDLNRKTLSELAINNPDDFTQIVESVKQKLENTQ